MHDQLANGGQAPYRILDLGLGWGNDLRYIRRRCEGMEVEYHGIEIQEHLAAGKTSTGQVMNIGLGRLYLILQKLGLKPTPHQFSARYLSVRQKAVDLNREGRPLDWISQCFNDQGIISSPSGKPWTRLMVCNMLKSIGEKPASFEEIHRRAITEARARGLKYEEMAIEFNAKGIRRRSRHPWTARRLMCRWSQLNRQRNRVKKRSTGADQSAPGDVAASA